MEIPPDLTNEEEIRSLPEKEFRTMIVKMTQNLGNRMEKIQEGTPVTPLISHVVLEIMRKCGILPREPKKRKLISLAPHH